MSSHAGKRLAMTNRRALRECRSLTSQLQGADALSVGNHLERGRMDLDQPMGREIRQPIGMNLTGHGFIEQMTAQIPYRETFVDHSAS